MTDDRLEERLEMVETQIKARGSFPEAVLEAMARVPRHLFVPAELQDKAYADGPLPIGHNQTISQPFIVASMTALIEPKPADRVLEVGLGSGYSAAVLAGLVRRVYAVEREGSFLPEALKRFKELGLDNIQAREGDGTLGWPEEAPFDSILVTAAGPKVPAPLLQQLKTGGSLVIPIGGKEDQKLVRVIKRSETHYQEKELYAVRFVPLIGQEGWRQK